MVNIPAGATGCTGSSHHQEVQKHGSLKDLRALIGEVRGKAAVRCLDVSSHSGLSQTEKFRDFAGGSSG